MIFSCSSLRGPNDVFLIRDLHDLEADLAKVKGDFKWNGTPEQVTSFSEKALVGKTLRSPEDFYFEGAEGKQVHGFVVKPYGWKEGDNKKWPGLLFIHGGTSALASLAGPMLKKAFPGPQGAWDDRWSTRWNPNVFGNQGYFVVAVNPTGSTTFGQG